MLLLLAADNLSEIQTYEQDCLCFAGKAPAPVQATTAATAATKAATGKPTSLYLGNLQWWTTDAELENLCAEYGPVNSLKIVDERQNGKSKGYAVVEFANAESAKACKEGLHG